MLLLPYTWLGLRFLNSESTALRIKQSAAAAGLILGFLRSAGTTVRPLLPGEARDPAGKGIGGTPVYIPIKPKKGTHGVGRLSRAAAASPARAWEPRSSRGS